MKKAGYRVLAADDEYWSRENLRSLFPWEENGYIFLEPACDGEEVLERMEEFVYLVGCLIRMHHGNLWRYMFI